MTTCSFFANFQRFIASLLALVIIVNAPVEGYSSGAPVVRRAPLAIGAVFECSALSSVAVPFRGNRRPSLFVQAWWPVLAAWEAFNPEAHFPVNLGSGISAAAPLILILLLLFSVSWVFGSVEMGSLEGDPLQKNCPLTDKARQVLREFSTADSASVSDRLKLTVEFIDLSPRDRRSLLVRLSLRHDDPFVQTWLKGMLCVWSVSARAVAEALEGRGDEGHWAVHQIMKKWPSDDIQATQKIWQKWFSNDPVLGELMRCGLAAYADAEIVQTEPDLFHQIRYRYYNLLSSYRSPESTLRERDELTANLEDAMSSRESVNERQVELWLTQQVQEMRDIDLQLSTNPLSILRKMELLRQALRSWEAYAEQSYPAGSGDTLHDLHSMAGYLMVTLSVVMSRWKERLWQAALEEGQDWTFRIGGLIGLAGAAAWHLSRAPLSGGETSGILLVAAALGGAVAMVFGRAYDPDDPLLSGSATDRVQAAREKGHNKPDAIAKATGLAPSVVRKILYPKASRVKRMPRTPLDVIFSPDERAVITEYLRGYRIDEMSHHRAARVWVKILKRLEWNGIVSRDGGSLVRLSILVSLYRAGFAVVDDKVLLWAADWWEQVPEGVGREILYRAAAGAHDLKQINHSLGIAMHAAQRALKPIKESLQATRLPECMTGWRPDWMLMAALRAHPNFPMYPNGKFDHRKTPVLSLIGVAGLLRAAEPVLNEQKGLQHFSLLMPLLGVVALAWGIIFVGIIFSRWKSRLSRSAPSETLEAASAETGPLIERTLKLGDGSDEAKPGHLARALKSEIEKQLRAQPLSFEKQRCVLLIRGLPSIYGFDEESDRAKRFAAALTDQIVDLEGMSWHMFERSMDGYVTKIEFEPQKDGRRHQYLVRLDASGLQPSEGVALVTNASQLSVFFQMVNPDVPLLQRSETFVQRVRKFFSRMRFHVWRLAAGHGFDTVALWVRPDIRGHSDQAVSSSLYYEVDRLQPPGQGYPAWAVSVLIIRSGSGTQQFLVGQGAAFWQWTADQKAIPVEKPRIKGTLLAISQNFDRLDRLYPDPIALLRMGSAHEAVERSPLRFHLDFTPSNVTLQINGQRAFRQARIPGTEGHWIDDQGRDRFDNANVGLNLALGAIFFDHDIAFQYENEPGRLLIDEPDLSLRGLSRHIDRIGLMGWLGQDVGREQLHAAARVFLMDPAVRQWSPTFTTSDSPAYAQLAIHIPHPHAEGGVWTILFDQIPQELSESWRLRLLYRHAGEEVVFGYVEKAATLVWATRSFLQFLKSRPDWRGAMAVRPPVGGSSTFDGETAPPTLMASTYFEGDMESLAVNPTGQGPALAAMITQYEKWGSGYFDRGRNLGKPSTVLTLRDGDTLAEVHRQDVPAEHASVSWHDGKFDTASDNTVSSLDSSSVETTSPDKRFLASGDREGYIRIWDLTIPTARRLLFSWKAHPNNEVWALAFSPDGSALYSAARRNGFLRKWQLVERTVPQPLRMIQIAA